jgi:predicted molibdopterin-dependent oxidoreductase YjgC
MNEAITIRVDGRAIAATREMTVAAALLNAGIAVFGHTESGEPRGPVCLMGVCHQCHLTIAGQPHRRACQTLCEDGLEVSTR